MRARRWLVLLAFVGAWVALRLMMGPSLSSEPSPPVPQVAVVAGAPAQAPSTITTSSVAVAEATGDG